MYKPKVYLDSNKKKLKFNSILLITFVNTSKIRLMQEKMFVSF